MKFQERARASAARLKEVEELVESATRLVAMQEPRVSAITSWLEARKRENGFGEDFEWTLRNPRNYERKKQ